MSLEPLTPQEYSIVTFKNAKDSFVVWSLKWVEATKAFH